MLVYRGHVDAAVTRLLERIADERDPRQALIEMGLNHEQQHQELILTDIKHVLWTNPLRPAYREGHVHTGVETATLSWIDIAEGVHEIGHAGDGFAYDNESPRHRVYLQPARLASRLVTSGEYLTFMRDGGYRRPELWMSAGWATVDEQGWRAPFYGRTRATAGPSSRWRAPNRSIPRGRCAM